MAFDVGPGVTGIHGVNTTGHCQMQRIANWTFCIEEDGDLVDPGLTPVHFFWAFEAQTDSRAAIGFRMQAGVRKMQWLQGNIAGRPVLTGGLVRPDRTRQNGEAFSQHFGLTQTTPVRRELDDGQRRDGPHIVWPQQAHQTFGQLWQVVIKLFTQTAHQESKAFEQAFHIRIAGAGFIQIKHRSTIRMSPGKLFTGFSQVAHLCFVIAQG